MKFYTLEYNANLPTKQQVNIPTNTDYKIGVKVVRNGELLDLDPADVTLGSLSADADKTNGYVTFTTVAGDDSSYTQKSLVIDSDSIDLKFDLVENIFKSQQGDIGLSGGGDVPADVATQSWVNSQISDFITDDALVGYATESFVNSTISDFVEEGELTAYATKDELTGYATKDELTGYAETADLTAYATKEELTGYVENDDLTAYYTKSETSSATELADAFAGAGGSAISAFDMSEDPVMSKAFTLQAARWGDISYDNTYALLANGSVNILTSDTIGDVGTTVYLNIGHKVGRINLLYQSEFAASYCLRITFPKNGKNMRIGDQAFRWLRFNKITLPDYVKWIHGSSTFNSSYLKIIDFGNTRGDIPSLESAPNSFVAADAKIYVPDALYDTWVAANNWSSISSQIYHQSELVAPYATDIALSALSAATGGGGGDSYTKAETDALLSAKADATKQLPADLTSWITDGWTYEDETEGLNTPFTELTTGFYDISPYCDYTVSAQYVYGWTGYYYTTYLFSYCTNGKTIFCNQAQNSDVEGTGYEGNISGNISVYFEVDTTKIPDGMRLATAAWEYGAVDQDSVKWIAYVSENMDGQAPYTLQELSTFSSDPDDDGIRYGEESFFHNATEDVTPGFVEVSAVYGNEISGFINQQGLTSYIEENVNPMFAAKVSHDTYTGESTTPPDIFTMTTIYETDWADISAGADKNTFYVVLPDPA